MRRGAALITSLRRPSSLDAARRYRSIYRSTAYTQIAAKQIAGRCCCRSTGQTDGHCTVTQTLTARSGQRQKQRMSREFSLRTRADTRWLYIVNCVIKSRQLASAPAVFCGTVEGRVLNFLECVTVGLGQLNPRKFVQSSNQTQIAHKHQFRNTEGAQPTIVSSLRSLSAIEWTERRTTVLWLSNATKTFGGRRLQVVCREIL